MTNQENHQRVIDEVRQLVPDVGSVEIEPPAHIMVAIAAERRWALRNEAALAAMNLKLARKRQSYRETKAFGEVIDRCVKDMAEIDREFPEAKHRMALMDEARRSQMEQETSALTEGS